ncbi:class I SAM-dependent methyltransferase [Conexibacter sp. SYSU D00693]|uniref:methyltransferase domain-containing protein n=1 Tax=Conexibacter sp. SYSU D00693 TaxID=2812560 RepID=UPI00196B5011|nr:class I SAM-dependent methyltransferase [Conexibacter sp. SYSU D00693]
MSATHAPAYGEQFAPFYDRLFPREGAMVDAAVARLAALHRPQDGPPLELGVGTGRLAVPLSERVGRVVGVDASPEMLAELARMGGDVEPVLGDLRDFRDGGGHGLVVCALATLTILLHREEQQAALHTLAAAAAPGAAVVVETHNPDHVALLHDGRRTETRLFPVDPPRTALLSQMTLHDGGLWELAHLLVDDGDTRVASEAALLVAPDALDAMAAAAGLELEARHATWAGHEVAPELPMVVSTYRRAS